MKLHAAARFPSVPPTAAEDPATIERDMIEKGQANMGKQTTPKPRDTADGDIIIDLGDGLSVFYAAGTRIHPAHQGRPSKPAALDEHGGMVAPP